MGHGPAGRPLWTPFDQVDTLDPEERLALLGGKGVGLATMTALGLPVPPGFTISTEACRRHLAGLDDGGLDRAIAEGIDWLERKSGRRLGDADAPLLVSVRSGAPVSMPGMLDTVLDVGMSADVEAGLAGLTGDPAFARDTHCRSLRSFAELVAGGAEDLLAVLRGVEDPGVIREQLAAAGIEVPSPSEQVRAAVRAVFGSWGSARARHYRRIEGLDDETGTAATVQQMVFGNAGDDSGTGVVFSRDPSTGVPVPMGDFLAGAQGEDVVAGDHQTLPLSALKERWPGVWEQLSGIVGRLERELVDMVDVEFTVERGDLWVLQVRPGKRSRRAALRIAVDLADDPTFPVDRAEAVRRCHGLLDDEVAGSVAPADAVAGDGEIIGEGLAASPGVGSGVLCLDVDRAVELDAAGIAVVLARRETSPADVHGMAVATGLVTTRGGLVSHAAVVARSWGIPAVVGADELTITDEGVIGRTGLVAAGTPITVDGTFGRVVLGAQPGDEAAVPEAEVLRRWRDELATGRK